MSVGKVPDPKVKQTLEKFVDHNTAGKILSYGTSITTGQKLRSYADNHENKKEEKRQKKIDKKQRKEDRQKEEFKKLIKNYFDNIFKKKLVKKAKKGKYSKVIYSIREYESKDDIIGAFLRASLVDWQYFPFPFRSNLRLHSYYSIVSKYSYLCFSDITEIIEDVVTEKSKEYSDIQMEYNSHKEYTRDECMPTQNLYYTDWQVTAHW